MERGPYRALRDLRTGDFTTVYAAARCWLRHENPYERADLKRELINSRTPVSVIQEQDQHASLYPISCMPFVALIAWLPWMQANVIWCLLSLGCFAASIVALLQDIHLPNTGKWIAASICLFFSPTYVGVLNGNPSVFSISIVILSIHFAIRERRWISGLLFAVALCVKPQIALCAFLALLLWKCWSSLLLGSVVAAAVSIIAFLQISSYGQSWQWWSSLQQNLVKESSPRGLMDPRPIASGFLNSQTLSYLLSSNTHIAEGLVVALMTGLILLYFYCRMRDRSPGEWVDAAFFAAVTIAVAYHRYYDGQLLLVVIPAVVQLWRNGRVRTAWVLSICFILIAFPVQSVFAREFPSIVTTPSLAQFVLFRHEPLAVLTMILVLGLSQLAASRHAEGTQDLVPSRGAAQRLEV